MGIKPQVAEWAVRFSLSPHTTDEEIDYAARRIGAQYDLLKRVQRRYIKLCGMFCSSVTARYS